MLTGTLALHDVRDVAALANHVVGKSGLELAWHEREDLVAYLIATAWGLSCCYDPDAGGPSFCTWATSTLKRRTIDWQRARFGRTTWKFSDRPPVERPRTVVVSHDENPELLGSVSPWAGDPADGGSPDLARLLAGGGRGRILGISSYSASRLLDELRDELGGGYVAALGDF